MLMMILCAIQRQNIFQRQRLPKTVAFSAAQVFHSLTGQLAEGIVKVSLNLL